MGQPYRRQSPILSLVLPVVALLPPLAPAAAQLQWKWQNPTPQGNALQGVWGSGPNDVFAVGLCGTIVHYDGSTWSVMASPTGAHLRGVWGTGASNVYAVGDSGTILHYDGAAWSKMTSGTQAHLWAIWGSAPDRIFAVGADGVALRWNGMIWSSMNTGTTQELRAVWGSGANDVYAVGSRGTILRYDGVVWLSKASGTSVRLNGVWGTGPGNIYVAGDDGTLLEYDGSSWSRKTTGTTRDLMALWGSGPGRIYALGQSGTVLRYDGSTWSSMASGTNVWLNGVWGSGPNGIFAVGDDGLVLYCDGTIWSRMSGSLTNDLLGLWGTGPSNVYAIGADGVILRYNGSTWTSMASGTSAWLRGIWGSGPGDIYVVGEDGTILHGDGSAWTSMASETTMRLHAVAGTGPGDVYAVGEGGTILHYDGSAWTSMTSGTSAWLRGVWAAGPAEVFAVGDDGTIVRYDGSTWSRMSSGTTARLEEVWGSSPTNVYAVGGYGTVLRFDGTKWSTVMTGGTTLLYGIWAGGADDVYVVGTGGVVLHYDGTTWSTLDSGTTNALYAIWGSSPLELFAVGRAGTILYHYQPPTGTVQFGSASYWATQGAGPVTVTIVRSGGTAGGAGVRYATSDGSAQAGVHYTAASGAVTFADGQMSHSFQVAILNPPGITGNRTVHLTLSDPSGGIVLGSPSVATLTILDDAAAPDLSIANASIVEGNSGTTDLLFAVTLSATSTKDITVDYTTVDGSAEAGSDYTAVSGTLTIPAGQTGATIVVPVTGDTLYEPDETLEVRLSHADGAVIVQAQATGVIENDDAPPVTLEISIGNAARPEGDSGTADLLFTVTLSTAATQDVTVDYATADGSATAGSDYTAISGTLTIPAGQTSKTIAVSVLGDTIPEPDEMFQITLTNPIGAVLGAAEAYGVIENDDAAVEVPELSIAGASGPEGNGGTTELAFAVSLSAASAQEVSVRYATVDGTATAGSDYIATAGTLAIPAGQTSGTIRVAVTGDTQQEPDETFQVVLSDPIAAAIAVAQANGTILNDDGDDPGDPSVPDVSIAGAAMAEGDSGTANLAFAVTLSAATTQAVTVGYATVDGSATAGSDYTAVSGTLTIPPGQMSGAIEVPVIGDAQPEPDETFQVVLAGATGATIAVAEATGTILNDDAFDPGDPATPDLSIADAAAIEGNSGTQQISFAVTLSAASTAAVTVHYSTQDGSATAGSDYTAVSGMLTIPPGQMSGAIEVSVLGDTLHESDETFEVVLSDAVGATIARARATGTIRNDDAATGGPGGDPDDPTDPDDPDDPADPGDPADPDGPGGPSTKPSDPTKPDKPSDPGGSTGPDDPDDPNRPPIGREDPDDLADRGGCGAGAGAANLVVLYSLCWIGLGSVRLRRCLRRGCPDRKRR